MIEPPSRDWSYAPAPWLELTALDVADGLLRAVVTQPFRLPWTRDYPHQRWLSPTIGGHGGPDWIMTHEIVESGLWLTEACEGIRAGDLASERLARSMMPGGSQFSFWIGAFWGLPQQRQDEALSEVRSRTQTIATVLGEVAVLQHWLDVRVSSAQFGQPPLLNARWRPPPWADTDLIVMTQERDGWRWSALDLPERALAAADDDLSWIRHRRTIAFIPGVRDEVRPSRSGRVLARLRCRSTTTPAVPPAMTPYATPFPVPDAWRKKS